jgi:hypothetical protein
VISIASIFRHRVPSLHYRPPSLRSLLSSPSPLLVPSSSLLRSFPSSSLPRLFLPSPWLRPLFSASVRTPHRQNSTPSLSAHVGIRILSGTRTTPPPYHQPTGLPASILMAVHFAVFARLCCCLRLLSTACAVVGHVPHVAFSLVAVAVRCWRSLLVARSLRCFSAWSVPVLFFAWCSRGVPALAGAACCS